MQPGMPFLLDTAAPFSELVRFSYRTFATQLMLMFDCLSRIELCPYLSLKRYISTWTLFTEYSYGHLVARFCEILKNHSIISWKLLRAMHGKDKQRFTQSISELVAAIGGGDGERYIFSCSLTKLTTGCRLEHKYQNHQNKWNQSVHLTLQIGYMVRWLRCWPILRR